MGRPRRGLNRVPASEFLFSCSLGTDCVEELEYILQLLVKVFEHLWELCTNM